MQVHDLGWGCSGDGETWQIKTVADETPEMFRVSRIANTPVTSGGDLIPVKPISKTTAGTRFILSQRPLPHLGAVDQLGVHRAHDAPPFTRVEHRLVHIFHSELARLWKRDALRKAKNPDAELPPRLAETLAALQAGCSEKEVSLRLGISQHTVHNYVKALHQRLGVSSRGELLAKVPRADGFVPRLSLDQTPE
jgi:DNA-binding CsgD family transcriptional regulator